jgi:GPH family glycoside/pentoside/hexuronide:cation symporter
VGADVGADQAVSLRAKLLYSSSSLGGEALSQSRGAWLLYYYAPPSDADLPELLPLGLAGALLFVGRFLESLDDALIGFWSDRTRSRLGRRIPFVVLATPASALFAFLLFTPPSAGHAVTGFYFFLTLELYFFFATLSGGPYEALLPEIARTSRERVAVVGMKVYFGAAGAGFGLVVSGLVVDTLGFKAMALLMAGLLVVTRYAGIVGVWRTARASQAAAELPFRDAMRATFSNRYFLLFLPTFVLFQAGFQMMIGVLPYYATAVLGAEETGTWVAVLSATALATMVVCVPGAAMLARRTSKREVYSRSMLAAAAVFPLLVFAGFLPGVPPEAQIVVLMILAGVPLAGLYLFPTALIADIIDHDQTRTGLRREATFYGAQNFVEKTATSLSPLLLSLLLLLGRSAENPTGIRLVGPVAAGLVLAGWAVFRRYDLADDVLAQPAARRPGQA